MRLIDQVREKFLENPDRWIDGREFVTLGGFGGWSARIRDLRKPAYGAMTIENRVSKVEVNGQKLTRTEYRWVPDRPAEHPRLDFDNPTPQSNAAVLEFSRG